MSRFTVPSYLTALLLSAATAHAAPPAGQDALAGAQIKVDVGGRKLNLYCSGKGSPTVLFDAGLGGAGWDWSAVLPAVAQRTRACVYDRAGMGASEPAIRPSTVANASKDLNFLIKNTRALEAPLILVGAGYGAMVAQHFALRARGAVTGVVLVDAIDEDALPSDRGTSLDVALRCLQVANDGVANSACSYPATTLNGEIGARLAAAQAALVLNPAYWRARSSELDSLPTSAEQLRAARQRNPALTPRLVQRSEPDAIIAAVLAEIEHQQ